MIAAECAFAGIINRDIDEFVWIDSGTSNWPKFSEQVQNAAIGNLQLLDEGESKSVVYHTWSALLQYGLRCLTLPFMNFFKL